MTQAVIRSIAVNAAKGQHRAQRLFTELVEAVERENKQVHFERVNFWYTYKTESTRELKRREALGITNGEQPLPHPDHVFVDVWAGVAGPFGPVSLKEKVKYDRWTERKGILERERDERREDLARAKSKSQRARCAEELAEAEKLVTMLTDLLGNGWWHNLGDIDEVFE